MSQSKEEMERAYYNKKLLKESAQDELKNQFTWKSFLTDFIQFFLGIFIGRLLINLIGTETRFPSKIVCFMIDVLILAAMIFLVKAVFYGVGKLLRRS